MVKEHNIYAWMLSKLLIHNSIYKDKLKIARGGVLYEIIERAFTDPLNRHKVELQEFHARKRVRRHLEMLRKGYLRPDPTDNQSFKDFDLLPEGHKFRKVES